MILLDNLAIIDYHVIGHRIVCIKKLKWRIMLTCFGVSKHFGLLTLGTVDLVFDE